MQLPPKPTVLCEYRDRSGLNKLTAVVDEVTLTYSVVLRDGTGATRPLRRYLPTLRAARSWALNRRHTLVQS